MIACEVLAVGTELLLGQIVDTNSAWIGEQLAAAGIACHHQGKVGDNRGRIVEALELALGRADAVVACGGLGPTHDDITREAVADVMGVSLELDEGVAARIRALFAARNRPMPDNNLRQAMVPAGAEVIPQVRGTAPGLICPVGDRVVYVVPGVPHEMREMVERAVLPDLRRRSGDPSTIASRVVRTWGESESGLEQRLRPLIDELDRRGTPTLAFLASGWDGLKIRLTARAATDAEAAAVLDEWEARLRAELGLLVFGVDDQSMEVVVLDLLRDRGMTLGLAESLTGGLVAARLTDVPGASDVVRGSIVSYATEVKQTLLGLPPGPVVNEAAAARMAAGARDALRADVGLALTGVAGPAEQEGVPVGTVCISACLPDADPVTATVRMPGQREQIRQYAVISSLDLLRRQLLAAS
jgi:nicotinamide-nucleotide amidase